MSQPTAFWFQSSLFKIEPDEDSETNPGIYGRQLAEWLALKLRSLGCSPEVIVEDWGRCIICQRNPARLFIGCANVTGTGESSDLVWHAFVECEIPILKRIFKRVDADALRSQLATRLATILAAEPQIKMVEEP